MGVDSLHCPLGDLGHCYANPPWRVILPWVVRLRENPLILCMMIVPFWDSTPWFAPLGANASAGVFGNRHQTLSRDVSQLFRGGHGPEMAPPLRSVIRAVLESKKVPSAQIDQLLNDKMYPWYEKP